MALQCVPQAFTHIVDFQGNVLDNAFSNAFNNNPIMGASGAAVPAAANQLWQFKSVTTTPPSNAFTIVNGAAGAPFLSFAAVPGNPRFCQTTVATQPRTFTVECVTNTSAIIRAFDMALTTWVTLKGVDFTPVTYEIPNGRIEQIWKLT
ncbi:hypothetical protein C8J57DRAFT_1504129 [Mycena rebaudengoi]|nr:hypothetical protein C8J57DRAFT_1504129 [Mycena rebaudengoi]